MADTLDDRHDMPPATHTDHEQVTASEETRAPAASVWGASSTNLDDWLAILPDGMVLVRSGKVELGTGVRTALLQVVAEELDLPLDRLRMAVVETGISPNEGMTVGSMTMRMGGVALRSAAAEARQALLEAAAERLEASIADLVVADGAVAVAGSPSRRVTFADLYGGRPFKRTITGTAPRKPPADYHIAGTPAARVDLPAKFTGDPAFLQNLRLPGMLHARVIRPPSGDAELVTVDPASVAHIPRVRVIQHANFLAVVAAREIDAIRATTALKVEWRTQSTLPAMDDLYAVLLDQPTQDTSVEEQGDIAAGWGQATRRFEATYHTPYHAHASIGPSCAVAAPREDGDLTVWSNTQGVYMLRASLSRLLDLPEERVHVIYLDAAGCYGQNGTDDAAADAALLAHELGVPIRVQWTREQEFVWEPKSPAMMMRVRAGLDDQGHIVAWERDTWSPTHIGRRALLAETLMHRAVPTGGGWNGGGDRNEATTYAWPATRTQMHWLEHTPLRTSSMRSLGAFANCFANECAVDELAALTGTDPLAFRLAHLEDPRGQAVLRAAADASSWGTPLPADEGRGLSYLCYGNTGAYVATVAHVRVDASSGVIRLLDVTVAHDCGLIINPDGLRNQIEGNIIQSASRALKEEVRFDPSGILSRDWETYPILTFSEVPTIEVILLDRPSEPMLGAGEPATCGTAPAIANAVYAATGLRLRQTPFTPDRVRAALAASSPPA